MRCKTMNGPQDAPPHDQDRGMATWNEAIDAAIAVVESYRVSVGNSPAGELAAEWTMQALREIRDELRELRQGCEHEHC